VRLLTIHADRFAFAVTGEASAAALAGGTETPVPEVALDELLVAFMAVEKGDESSPGDIAEQAAGQVRDTALRVGAKRVMLYPYAHLSSDLASPRAALQVLIRVSGLLQAHKDLEVHRAPFGYYKSFDIAVKGHPLSELARTIVPRDGPDTRGRGGPLGESAAIAAEKTLRSQWRIYRPDGSYVMAGEFDFSSEPGLRQLYAYEREGTRVAEQAPPHIRLMREQEIADYEPASDSGNMRWYPRGLLIKRLLEHHVTTMVAGHGAMEVETPIMYDGCGSSGVMQCEEF
jgi:threonyl-tRNA synthetase